MFQILTFQPLPGQKGFSSTLEILTNWEDNFQPRSSAILLPCSLYNSQFCASVKDVKKELWHSKVCKDCSCSGDKGEGTRRDTVSDRLHLLWTSVLPVSVFSPPSVSLCWSQYVTSPRALLLQPTRGPGGSSLCVLHWIPCGSAMKFRSQLGSASPTGSLLALGQIHNFSANSSSAKTPNWLPEDLNAKYVSAITHSSCKTSMTLEKILGALLDLEKSFFRRVFLHITLASPAAVGQDGQPLQLSQAWVGAGQNHAATKIWSTSQVRLVLALLPSHFAALAIVTGWRAIFQLETYKARK